MAKQIRLTLAGLALSAVAAGSVAQADSFTPYAGLPGPTPYNDTCDNPKDQIGIDVRAGTYVDAVQLTCAGTSYYLRPWRGGDGGAKVTLCPAAQLTGIEAWSGSIIDAIRGVCWSADRGAHLGNRAGGDGGDYSSLRCARGATVRGIRGEWGTAFDGFTVVDRIALRCSPVAAGALGAAQAAR